MSISEMVLGRVQLRRAMCHARRASCDSWFSHKQYGTSCISKSTSRVKRGITTKKFTSCTLLQRLRTLGHQVLRVTWKGFEPSPSRTGNIMRTLQIRISNFISPALKYISSRSKVKVDLDMFACCWLNLQSNVVVASTHTITDN